MLRFALAGLLVALVGTASYAADTYKLTAENTKVEFTGTKKDGKHTGGFKMISGTVTHDKDWAIEVTIDTTSIFSDDEKLTGHLKGGDFFNVKDNPTAKFVTTKIEKGDAVTPAGLFKVTRERPEGWWEGDLGKIYRPKYFVGGIAIHGMTSVPNYPASHGCVRLSTQAMDFVWDSGLVPVGTPVWVHE